MAGIIVEVFDRVASEHRNRVAVHGLSEHVTRTFGELRDDANALDRALTALSLPAHPTIVSHIGNRTGFIPLFLASLARDAALLSVDGDAPAPEVLEMAGAYGADLVVVPAGVAAFEALTPIALPCGLAGIARRPAQSPSWRRPGDADALVLKVTSGSTRASQVVIASERNLFSDGQHVAEAMGIGPRDVGLAAVPMAHAYGMGNLLLPLLLQGSSLVLRDRFVPAEFASDVRQFGVTMFPGVPFIFDYLRRAGDTAAPIADIRLLVTAGAPIDFQTLQYFKDRFGVKVHSLYGTSETGSITFDSSDEVSDPVSVGWPLAGTTVTLVAMQELSPGEGRIKVQGAAVCQRYAYDDTGERMSSFTPDGFLTADLGAFAEDGRLTLLGRVSGFVNVAGRKVHPREVERVIARLPDVLHVQVLGVAGGAHGEELVACVHRRDAGLSATAIRSHCARALSPYKVPRRIVFADELPVSGRGKTGREAIEALLRTFASETDGL